MHHKKLKALQLISGHKLTRRRPLPWSNSTLCVCARAPPSSSKRPLPRHLLPIMKCEKKIESWYERNILCGRNLPFYGWEGNVRVNLHMVTFHPSPGRISLHGSIASKPPPRDAWGATSLILHRRYHWWLWIQWVDLTFALANVAASSSNLG